jgi:uncharacterized protein
MRRSIRSSLFPDVNVWIALAYRKHIHHLMAKEWLQQEEDSYIFFSRITQLGLLRLLTTKAMMGKAVRDQAQAWEVYDELCADDRVHFIPEPAGFTEAFRRMAQNRAPSPKDWADSYLAAFAASAGLTLVTFDKAFHTRKDVDSLVLGG